MKRRIWHRLHDRTWSEVGKLLSSPARIPDSAETDTSSVSASMPWARICEAYAAGNLTSHQYRRTTAVRDIVETVGAEEGRFYARRIHEWDSKWLTDPRIADIDTWGDPIRWPGFLLGTPRAFSPTTLRYMATALWLKKNGYLAPGARVTEIGVGFGGLAAMNALVSQAYTTLADLPQVERAALKMLDENKLAGWASPAKESDDSTIDLIISNYAFTELNSTIQEEYLHKHLKRATRGVIVSNSSVFAKSIQGRSDEELVSWLQGAGINAKLDLTNEILGPGDHLNGVTLIHW